ncbi:MAG TPA: hypothetical protein PKB10_00935, partial [Tepidisphaeraceae bacterium]|nr:hypothetical protein [Tepidisphaeraceae bacterium]
MRRLTRCLPGSSRSTLESLERRQLLNGAFDLAVNFQPAGAPVPSGFVVDSGQTFGNRGNGFSYGWDAPNNSTRDRNRLPDQSRDTLIHLQKDGNFTWELAVPNGEYQVELVAGDADYFDSVFRVNVEGTLLLSGTPTSGNRFVSATGTVQVTDGRLTLSSGDGAINNKLAFVRVSQPTSNPGLFAAKVNFQTPTSPTPSGFLADTGSVFGSRGNGFSFGWNALNSNNTRDRNTLTDQSFDTLTHLQRGGDFVWEITVPNGRYAVSLTAGDPDFFDGTFRISVEGSLGLSGSPTSGNRFVTGNTTVDVTDGRLTIRSADGAVNNKLSFVEIQQLDDGGPVTPPPPPPSLTSPVRINFQPDGRPVPD